MGAQTNVLYQQTRHVLAGNTVWASIKASIAPVGEGFARGMPIRGNALAAGRAGDDAADDGAGGIAVAKGADGRPHRLFEIVEMPGGAPEREGHGVLARHPAAVAERLRGNGDRSVRRQIAGALNAGCHRALRHMRQDRVEEGREVSEGGAFDGTAGEGSR